MLYGVFTKSLLLPSVKELSEEEKEKEENAAVKIQAVFRGHLAREEVKKMKDGDVQEEKAQEDN